MAAEEHTYQCRFPASTIAYVASSTALGAPPPPWGLSQSMRSSAPAWLKSATPRAILRDIAVQLVNEDAETARWELLLYRASDLPAGFSSWVDAGNTAFPSPVEYSVEAVDMLASSGLARRVLGGFLPSGGGSDETTAGATASLPYVLSSDIDGASDVLVLCGQAVAGNMDVWGLVGWTEDL